MNTHDRAARLLRAPEWREFCEGQRAKGLAKWGVEVDAYDAPSCYWRLHATEEAVDGVVYSFRLSDTGHSVRGRLAAFLFACAARVLLTIR